MNGILGQITAGVQQLEVANNLRAAFGAALTEEQQIAVSDKVVVGGQFNPNALLRWLATDEGRKAARGFAEAFIGKPAPSGNLLK